MLVTSRRFLQRRPALSRRKVKSQKFTVSPKAEKVLSPEDRWQRSPSRAKEERLIFLYMTSVLGETQAIERPLVADQIRLGIVKGRSNTTPLGQA